MVSLQQEVPSQATVADVILFSFPAEGGKELTSVVCPPRVLLNVLI